MKCIPLIARTKERNYKRYTFISAFISEVNIMERNLTEGIPDIVS